MICKRLFEFVSNCTGDRETALHEYGSSCGETRQLDFNKIDLTLNELKIKTIDKDACLRTIINGFCQSLRGSENAGKSV